MYYYYYYVIKTKTVWRVWLNNQTGCYKITADIHNTWNERTSQVHCGIQYCTVWADYIVSLLENAVDRSAFLCIQKICILLYVHNIYWMNELCIYIALYCVLLYTQSTLQSCGGSLLNHHQCAASTRMMRWLPQDNGARALTTHQLQVERRERFLSSGYFYTIKWMGIIRRPWLTRASEGNLARTPGLHPYSLREVPWDF